MSASLLTVWRAARARVVPFAGESAGYVVLLACEELALSPRRVELANLSLDPDGAVRTLGREPAAEAQAEAELRSILGELLQVASSPGVGLLRAAAREPSGNLRTLGLELQRALIPVNRAAARRALSRLCRETARACENGTLAPLPGSQGQTDPVQTLPRSAPPDPLAPSSLPCLAPAVSEVLDPAKSAGWKVQSPAEHPTRPETVVARRRSGLSPAAAPGPDPEGDATEQFAFAFEPSAQGDPLPEVEPKSDALTPAMVPGPRREKVERLQPSRAALPVASVSGEPQFSSEPDAGLWPMELANQGGALPLEVEWIEPNASRELELSDLEILWETPPGLEQQPTPWVQGSSGATELDADQAPSSAVYPGMPPQKSDVRQLLGGFEVAQALADAELRDELKRWAGIEGTPAPKTRLGQP